MSRSSWKPLLLNNKKNTNLEKNYNYIIYNRNDVISDDYLNKNIKIHNGMKFFEILVTEKLVGRYFREFAPTRKIPLHKKKKIHQKKQTKK